MNQPFTVPLFLPRLSSDHSQLKRWRTVAPGLGPGRSRCRRIGGLGIEPQHRRPRCRRRPADVGPAAPETPSPRPRRRLRGGGCPAPAGDTDRSTGPGPGPCGPSSSPAWPCSWPSLDNLVVSTALPVIRVHLHAGLSGLEWTVNAYTLTFAVLLLSAAAIGERFGRRRIFVLGIAVFTAASAAAALAPSIGGAGRGPGRPGRRGGHDHAAVADPAQCRGHRPSGATPPSGSGGAIGGAAVAIGPLVGGAVTSGWSWQYIFWLNVPVGLVLIPLAWWKLSESRGTPGPPRPGGGGAGERRACSAWSSAWSEGNAHGWTSTSVLASFVVGAVALHRLHRLGAAVRPSHAGHPAVPPPGLRLGERHRPAVQLRDVRVHLLPDPVPPDRPGPLPAGRRDPGAALDGDGRCCWPRWSASWPSAGEASLWW